MVAMATAKGDVRDPAHIRHYESFVVGSGLGLLGQRNFQLLAVRLQHGLERVHALQLCISLSNHLLRLLPQCRSFGLNLVVLREPGFRFGKVLVSLSISRHALRFRRDQVCSREEVVHTTFDQIDAQGKGIDSSEDSRDLSLQVSFETVVVRSIAAFQPRNNLGVQASPSLRGRRINSRLQLFRKADLHLGVFAAHGPNDRPRWCKDPTNESAYCAVNHSGLYFKTWTTVVHKGAK